MAKCLFRDDGRMQDESDATRRVASGWRKNELSSSGGAVRTTL